jgi:hypothetical protein
LLATEHLQAPWNDVPRDMRDPRPGKILEALESLAFGYDDPDYRAERLFTHLRKASGKSVYFEYLTCIQDAIRHGGPLGARLLSAFLAVSTPADRLLPRVMIFHSSRRIHGGIREFEREPGIFHQDWLARLDELVVACERILPGNGADPASGLRAGWEPPWGPLKDGLDLLVARLRLEDEFSNQDRSLLVGLLRLEVDAWQERVSLLAGSIDPFRVAAVSRVLPLLNRADAEIRDLRAVISNIEERQPGSHFHRPAPRAFDILEEDDREALGRALASSEELAPLRLLFVRLADHPVPVADLAHGVDRLMTIGHLMSDRGPGVRPPDLLSAVSTLQPCYEDGRFKVPLAPDFADRLGVALVAVAGCAGPVADLLPDVVLDGVQLVIEVPQGGAFPEHDLPVGCVLARGSAQDNVPDEAGAGGANADDEAEIDPMMAGASELKKLVLGNIMAVSVLLGFLRNPKITAVPGLVEDVVTRTRNPVVIETVAKVRVLHTGFANRGVALACLRSPVNVPVSVLRKFIHVKYVSKTDLKRLANDSSGVRKEIGREVQKYLASLT